MRRTYQQARSAENKPICFFCFVPCDPKSREYRATGLCPACHDATPLIIHRKGLPCLIKT